MMMMIMLTMNLVLYLMRMIFIYFRFAFHSLCQAQKSQLHSSTIWSLPIGHFFFFFNSTLYLILMMVVYILQSTGKLCKMLFLNFISLAVHLIVKWHLSNNITTSIPHRWFSVENSTFLRKHHSMSCFQAKNVSISKTTLINLNFSERMDCYFI